MGVGGPESCSDPYPTDEEEGVVDGGDNGGMDDSEEDSSAVDGEMDERRLMSL